MLSYEKDVAMIPAAALSTHSANELSAQLKTDPKLTVNLKLSAAQHPLVPSFNVMGELTGPRLAGRICGGRRPPRLVGSGTGAQDDGAGVVHSIEVLRTLKKLDIHLGEPSVLAFHGRRIRRGRRQEYSSSQGEKREALCRIESDSGGFAPCRLRLEGSRRRRSRLYRSGSLSRSFARWHRSRKAAAGPMFGPLSEIAAHSRLYPCLDSLS